MKRVILIVAAVLLFIVLGVLAYLWWPRPAAPRAADILPDSTLVFVEVPNFPKSRAALQQSAAWALWQEPEVQAFLAQPRQALRDALGAQSAQQEAALARTLNALKGELFVAVSQVTIIPNFQASIVVGADLKHKLLESKLALASLENDLRAHHPDIKLEHRKYLGINYTRFEKNADLVVCYGYLNSMVVFTLGEDAMRDTISRFTRRLNAESPSLASSKTFQNVVAHMPPGHEFIAYANVEEMTSLSGPFLALISQGSGALQKLASIEATGLSATFTRNAIQEVRFTAYKANHQPEPVTQRQTMALTAPHTLLYLVQPVNLTSAHDELLQTLLQLGQPQLTSSIMQFEKSIRDQNVRIRDDALAALGPETAVIGQWRSGAQYPDLAIVTEVKNSDKTRAALAVVLNALKQQTLGNDEQIPWDESSHAGQTLRTIHLGAGKVAPSYTVTDRFFILASSPEYAQELLDQVTGSKPTLAASEAYQQAMRPLPPNGSSYGYCDLPGIYPPLQALVRNGLADAPHNDFVDLDKFPRAETVAKHLFPFASATTGDQQSQTTTSYSPFGTPVGILAGAAGGFVAARALSFTPATVSPTAPPKPSSDKPTRLPPPGNPAATSRTPASE